MDSVTIATTLLGMQQSNTRQQIQTAVAKSAMQQDRAVIDMIAASTANLANLQASPPAGMGAFVNRTA